MAKAESQSSLRIDQLGVILTVTVLILSTFQFFSISFIPLEFLRYSFALAALLASFIYFSRVRNFTDSSNTPLSDTLVVLGGIFLAFSLFLENLNYQDINPNWALIFIGLGVIGRLFLLDTGLKVLVDGVFSFIGGIIKWSLKSPIYILRTVLLATGFILLFVNPQIISNPQSIAFFSISGFFLMGALQQERVDSFLRVAVIVISVFLAFASIFRLFDVGISVEPISLLTLSISGLFWAYGLVGIKRSLAFLGSIITTFFISIFNAIFRLFSAIKDNPIRFLRIIGNTLALIALFIGFLLFDGRYLLTGGALLVVSNIQILYTAIPSVLRSIYGTFESIFSGIYSGFARIYTSIRSDPIRFVQRVSIISAPFAVFLLPRENNLNLIVAGTLLLIAFLPSVLPPIYRFTTSILSGIYQAFKFNPRVSTQITLLILSLVTYFILPSDPAFGEYQQNQLIPLVLLIVGVSPTIILWLKSFLPVIQAWMISIYNFLIERVKNWSFYFWALLVVSIYQLFVLPVEYTYLRILFSFTTAVSLVFVGNGFAMEFIDAVHLGLIRLVGSLSWIVRFLRIFRGRTPLQSILAMVILLAGLTGFLIPDSYQSIFLIRLSLVILSILIWYTANPKRYKRFKNFFSGLFGGIFNALKSIFSEIYNFFKSLFDGIIRNTINLFNWILGNLLVVALFLLGIAFIIIAFGLFIPGTVGFVSVIFNNVLDNRLVSIIIAGFFVSLGIISMQQAFVRRESPAIKGGDQ